MLTSLRRWREQVKIRNVYVLDSTYRALLLPRTPILGSSIPKREACAYEVLPRISTLASQRCPRYAPNENRGRYTESRAADSKSLHVVSPKAPFAQAGSHQYGGP